VRGTLQNQMMRPNPNGSAAKAWVRALGLTAPIPQNRHRLLLNVIQERAHLLDGPPGQAVQLSVLLRGEEPFQSLRTAIPWSSVTHDHQRGGWPQEMVVARRRDN